MLAVASEATYDTRDTARGDTYVGARCLRRRVHGSLQFASVCTSVKIKLLYLWLLPNNFVFVIYILAMLLCLLW